MGYISRGWKTYPVGAGGLITGIEFAPNGQVICRADTYGVYRWSGTQSTLTDPEAKWIPLVNYNSLVDSSASTLLDTHTQAADFLGGWEFVMAPSNTNRYLLITTDVRTYVNKSCVYISNDQGEHWTCVNDATNFPAFSNASPNLGGSISYTKNANCKAAFDSNNADVMYVGMPMSSGNTYPIYRSIDGGTTWDGTWTSGVINSPTGSTSVGVAGILFDPAHGTTVVGGQTRTARLLVGVSGTGNGVYETWDGGQTWTQTSGGPTANFFQAAIDASGNAWYSDYNGSTGKLWRYIKGASQGNGTWTDMSTGSGWPSGFSIAAFACDPRAGSEGTVYCASDCFRGRVSTNALSAVNSVVWNGSNGTSSPAGTNAAASYDLPWAARERTTSFTGTSCIRCDYNGVLWVMGGQLLTYYTMTNMWTQPTTRNSIGRGTEQTVTSVACRPPGSPYVLLGMQDIGYVCCDAKTRYPATANRYPDAVDYPSFTWGRATCCSIDWAQSNPSIIAVRVSRDSRPGNEGTGSHFSGYSTDYGLTVTQFANQPDTIYGADGPGGGQILAFDANRYVCIPAGINYACQPCRTTDAGATSWSLCTDLPTTSWFLGGGFGFEKTGKPAAVDRVTAGRAYIRKPSDGQVYRTDDYGASWNHVGTRTMGLGGYEFLFSVPGYAGHLWLTCDKETTIYRSVDAGVNWISTGLNGNAITLPTGKVVYRFGMGCGQTASSYPTLYLLARSNDTSKPIDLEFFRSTDGGETWTSFGQLMTSLPNMSSIDGVKTISGDWVVFGRCYYGSLGSGWSYYDLVGDAVIPLRSKTLQIA